MRRLVGKHITGVQERKEERYILFEPESVNRNHTFLWSWNTSCFSADNVSQEFKNECFSLLSAVSQNSTEVCLCIVQRRTKPLITFYGEFAEMKDRPKVSGLIAHTKEVRVPLSVFSFVPCLKIGTWNSCKWCNRSHAQVPKVFCVSNWWFCPHPHVRTGKVSLPGNAHNNLAESEALRCLRRRDAQEAASALVLLFWKRLSVRESPGNQVGIK